MRYRDLHHGSVGAQDQVNNPANNRQFHLPLNAFHQAPQSQAAEANGDNLVRASTSSVILNAKKEVQESYLITPVIKFPTLCQTISTIMDYLVKQADVNLRHIPYKHVIGTVGKEELIDVLLNGICPEITTLEGQIIITER